MSRAGIRPDGPGESIPVGSRSTRMSAGREAPDCCETTSALADLPRRILVVDDNVETAQSLARLLEHWQYQTEVAHDGPAAIAAAQATPPYAILLDIGLPGMDGYEVTQQLRQHPSLHKTLIVALTGFSADGDLARSREAGFDLHLVKPVEPDVLQSLLDNPQAAARP
jgi:CheY-like chemotaxis protein